MRGKVFKRFLESNQKAALALSAVSEVLNVVPMPPFPAMTYLAEFRVRHLRRMDSGRVEVADGPVVAKLQFPADYLCSTDPQLPMKVVSILSPPNFVHPNVAFGSVCLGYRFAPGTRLELLLRELYEIVSYQNYTLDESNAMDAEACRLLRAHPELLDELQPKPLVPRRRRVEGSS